MKKKVLIIEDTGFVRQFLKHILKEGGYDIVGEANNGKLGVIKYKQTKPDIVTMDISMPEMSGIEALKEIIQINPEAKVLMITALGQEKMVKDAIINGAKSFVVKPFKKEVILRKLDQIL